MCGIVGTLNFSKNNLVNEALLTEARESLYHRGPDYGANYIDNNIGLGHRRLSILDLSKDGNQPMVCYNGRFVIVYNGEIYNYVELKQKLIKQGVLIKSNCDTEVLLNMYIEYGINMLQQLNGMFAFAIWDNVERKLFLARDRVGIKPLYVSTTSTSFYFASEIKALLKFNLTFNISEKKLNEFLLYRNVSGSETLFDGIYKILPGEYFIIDEKGNVNKQQWWNLANKIKNHSVITNPKEWFTATFDDAVKKHMISDVPIGVLLSGGLDSGAVCASLYKQQFKDIHTFNVGFKNFKDDESLQAAYIANKYNFPFHSIYVEDDDLAENLNIANYIFDEPLIHQNEPQLLAISRFAKKTITVLLSGEGADEFLGGYLRYRPLKYIQHKRAINFFLDNVPSKFKSARVEKLQRYFNLGTVDEMILFNSLNLFPEDFKNSGLAISTEKNDYRNCILAQAKEVFPNNTIRQCMYLDQHTYLQTLNDRNDRATMASSIECRVPFLDHRLLEGLGTLSNDYFFKNKKGKSLLSDSYKNLLPKQTLKFRKIGFSVPWLEFIFKSQKLKHYWFTMEDCELFKIGWLKHINLKTIRDTEEFNKASNQMLLRQLFFISIWWRQYKQHIS